MSIAKPDTADLAELVRRFSAAETSLLTFLERAKALSTAREELTTATREIERVQALTAKQLEEAQRTVTEQFAAADQAAVGRLEATVSAIETRLMETETLILKKFENAEGTLDQSQRALSNVASGIFRLTSELGDVARDMKDCAIALRALDPAKVDAALSNLAAGQRRLNAMLAVLAVSIVATAVVIGWLYH